VYDYRGSFYSRSLYICFKEDIVQIQATEASISNELLEDEELLWSGRPDPQRRRIVSPARVFLILGLVFLPIGLLAVIIGLILLLSSVIPPGSQASLLGLFIPGGTFFVLGLIYLIIGLVGFSPSRNTLYAITNRRVIILRPGRYTRASSYGKRAITQVHRIERPDGSGDLIFVGNPPYGSYGNNQYNSGTYNTGRQGAFSALPNVRLVEQKLIRMLNEE
jgi:hypothetical protein